MNCILHKEESCFVCEQTRTSVNNEYSLIAFFCVKAVKLEWRDKSEVINDFTKDDYNAHFWSHFNNLKYFMMTIIKMNTFLYLLPMINIINRCLLLPWCRLFILHISCYCSHHICYTLFVSAIEFFLDPCRKRMFEDGINQWCNACSSTFILFFEAFSLLW